MDDLVDADRKAQHGSLCFTQHDSETLTWIAAKELKLSY